MSNPPTTRTQLSGNLRTVLVVGGLLMIIFLLTFALNPPADNGQDNSAGSSHNAAQSGSLALYLWLGTVGYQPTRIEYSGFDIPAPATTLFVIEPLHDLSAGESQTLRQWVDSGHTLIWAETGVDPSRLLRDLHISLTYHGSLQKQASVVQPLTNPTVNTVQVNTSYSIDLSKHPDATVYIGSKEQPLLVGLTEGKGRIYLTSAPYLFSNEGLGAADNGRLVLNLLAATPDGSVIAVDEVHHGYVGSEDLAGELVNRRWGWGVLYGVGLLALYWILSGRRFGRIVPLVPPDTRRSSAEFVSAVASMFRRAGRRAWVVEHYRTTLRADLARPFALDPRLPTDRFAADLARLSPRPLDLPLLLGVLRQLDAGAGHEPYSEAALLDLERRIRTVRQMVLGLAT